jgi:hypothetical protein
VLKLDVNVIEQNPPEDAGWDEGEVDEEHPATPTPEWDIHEVSQVSKQLLPVP